MNSARNSSNIIGDFLVKTEIEKIDLFKKALILKYAVWLIEYNEKF